MKRWMGMSGMLVALMLALGLAILMGPVACESSLRSLKTWSPPSDGVTSSGSSMDSVMNLGVLNWLFAVCLILAAASVMAITFRLPVPPKTTAALIAIAIGAVVFKVLLVKYQWLIVILCGIGLVLAVAVLLMTRIKWLERQTGRDLNRNGKIGS